MKRFYNQLVINAFLYKLKSLSFAGEAFFIAKISMMQHIATELAALQAQANLQHNFIDRALAYDCLDRLLQYLFPITTACRARMDSLALLHEQFVLLIQAYSQRSHTDSIKLATQFINTLPAVYQRLLDDARAICAFDPAARSVEEVILSYLGFYAIAVYRICHELYTLQIPILPRLLSEYAHSKTGIDIHPGATIGREFVIDHGTGVVIGETTHIGNSVKIYQGVTLGALSVKKELADAKRHPTIEDNVVIYANATILGGATTVGHDSLIGGSVWLTHSVEPYSLVYHRSEIHIKNPEITEALNFVI